MMDQFYSFALRMGDTCLILSHRLGELCSKGPYLEEDIAMTNISLDLLGRAELFLEYATELEGQGKTADDLAYRRNERQYYNHLIAERPNSHFGSIMMRQFLNDAMMHPLFTGLKLSKDERFAAIGEKAVKESAYHLRHSRDWIIRLGDGTEESHQKIAGALDDLWPYTNDMFEWSEGEKELANKGIIPSFDEIRESWTKTVRETFAEAGLEIPKDVWMHSGGRDGIHSEYLGILLAEMQYLPRAYPNDQW